MLMKPVVVVIRNGEVIVVAVVIVVVAGLGASNTKRPLDENAGLFEKQWSERVSKRVC